MAKDKLIKNITDDEYKDIGESLKGKKKKGFFDKIKTKRDKEKDNAYWVNWIESNIVEHPIIRYHHPRMALAKNFFKGEQFMDINPETGEVLPVKITRENRSKNNFIKVLIKVLVSKILAGDPSPKFAAHEGNTEDFDNDVANVSEDLCSVLVKKEDFRAKNVADVKNAAKVGFGVAKVYFDNNSGASIGAQYGIEDDELKMGSVRRDIINPFHFFPDPTATSHKNMRWACHRYPVPVRVAEDAFDFKRGELAPDDKSEDRKDIRSTTTSYMSYDIDESSEDNDIVYINDIYLRANKEYPNGKHVTVVAGKVPVNEDNPQGRDLPFIMLKLNSEDDEIMGTSYVYDLISSQRDYNKLNSIIMENAEWTGFHKWYMERDRDYSKITNDGVGIVTGNSPEAPKLMQAKPLPDYLVSGPVRMYQIAQDTINIHNVDMSQVPIRGTNSSGKVIDELKESSRVAFSEDIGATKAFLEEINLKSLKLYQKHFTVNELITIVGENKRDKLEKFKKVVFSPTSFDMTIRIAEGFAQSPSSKFNQVMEMLNNGVFDSPHIGMVMKMIDNDGNMSMLVESYLADEVKAKYNLNLILKGEMDDADKEDWYPLVSQHDNHAVHKKIFIEFIKKPEWKEQTPEVKQALDRYVINMDMHEMANMQREMKKKQMQQQMMQQQQGPPQQQQGAPPTAAGIEQAEMNGKMGGVFADSFEKTPYIPPPMG